MEGNKPAKERMVVDFPVPRSPKISTPPIKGSIVQSVIASFISACETIAVKGKLRAIAIPRQNSIENKI
jgi:hypothetical protein